jgi:hypothetical protein
MSLPETTGNFADDHVLNPERIWVVKIFNLDSLDPLSFTRTLPMITVRYKKIEKWTRQFT